MGYASLLEVLGFDEAWLDRVLNALVDHNVYSSPSLDPKTIELMQSIKDDFDPNGILNPGKIFN